MHTENNYWNDRWNRNDTGWDLGEVSPPLKAFIDQLTDPQIRVLIPGCGNAYEAGYLLQKGFTRITVVDISATLTDRLRERYREHIDKELRVLHQDFFTLDEPFDLILEQTFFCALEPALRKNYVRQMKHLLQPEGKLAGVVFNTDFDQAGPPWGGNKAEYLQLFSHDFDILEMETTTLSVGPRAGNEFFVRMTPKKDQPRKE